MKKCLTPSPLQPPPPTPSPKGEGECWEQFAWERLNSFSNHRGISHSTPLPMGEGLGVGPVAFVTFYSPLHYFPLVSDRWFGEGLGVRLFFVHHCSFSVSNNAFDIASFTSFVYLRSVKTCARVSLLLISTKCLFSSNCSFGV